MTHYTNERPGALGKVTRTTKFILLFAIAGLFPQLAKAQGSGGTIVHDACHFDFDYNFFCDVFFRAADGTNWASVADGVTPAWSPDGSRIVFAGFSQPGLFMLNLANWSVTRVFDFGASPSWSPNGLKLAFSDNELYVMNVDGSGVVQLTSNMGFLGEPAWSPDGATIAFDCVVEVDNYDICAINSDGTGFRRLTFSPEWDSGPDFSPNGSIAFATTLGGYTPYIAVMNPDGTGIFLAGVVPGIEPTWSPDGTQIAFVAFEYICDTSTSCSSPIYVMNPDGSDQRPVAWGDHPDWGILTRPLAWFFPQDCNGLNCPFDGSGSWAGNAPIVNYTWDFGDGQSVSGATANHTYSAIGTYRVTLAVTNDAGVTSTQSRDLVVSGNIWPTARITYSCTGWLCTFDGSGSSDPDGSIVSYQWLFSNMGGPSTPTASHLYNAAGIYTVTLFVTDDRGAEGSQQQIVDLSSLVNVPPVASFTIACTGLTCFFDGLASSDPDGVTTWFAWDFGDGATGYGFGLNRATHTYASGGVYPVSLTVTDNSGASTTRTESVTVIQPTMHIGDLDGTRTNQQNTWVARVTITIHGSSHTPVANAMVTGSWNIGGTASCTTDGSGQCYLERWSIPRKTQSVGLTIVNVTKFDALYTSGDNHDPDGDSNGTSITVSNR